MRRLLLLSCLLPGCVRPVPGPVLHPVTGRVIVYGEPAGGATLAFHPMGREGRGPRIPVGAVGADGTFRLTTSEPGDGAEEGEYVVTIAWPDPTRPYDECGDQPAHDKLQGRYADPRRSPLRARVVPGPNEFRFRPVVDWSSPRLKDRERLKESN